MPKTEGIPAPGEVVATACQDPFLEIWTEPSDGPAHTVVDVLRGLAARHEELASALASEDATAEWGVRSERLIEYRRKLDAEILEPLCDVYEGRAPAKSLERALQGALETAVERCGDLDESVEAAWTSDALDRQPSDSAARRAGKTLAKVVSAARKAGQSRTVPLRAAAVHHLDRVVLPGQDALGGRALIGWATWGRRLEQLWVEWGRRALPSLVRAELLSAELEEAEDLWTKTLEAARELQAGLQALLEDCPGEGIAQEARAELGAARGVLEADLAVAGSFLFHPSGTDPSGTLSRVPKIAEPLCAWDDGVAARLQLYRSLTSILSGATGVRQRTVYRLRERCLSETQVLAEIATRIDGLASRLVEFRTSEDVRTRLEELDGEIRSALESAETAFPPEAALEATIREVSDGAIEALSAMVRQMPATLPLHSVEARVPTRGRSAETRLLSLQELTRQSFDALRMERIHATTGRLSRALREARANVTDLEGVYAFARDEALRELDTDGAETLERARDLVRGSLTNTAEALRNQLAHLDAALEDVEAGMASEFAQGANGLLDRVGAGRMEARLFAARSRFAALQAWLAARFGPPVRRATRAAQVRLGRLRSLGARFLRRGSAIVGGPATETEESTRTLRALADLSSATQGLPLVYQRLFTLDPVADPSLFAGRQKELADGLRRWRRWREADGVPLIVRGRQGSGITSFLNVLESQVQSDGASVVHDTLEERITSEEELAGRLAGLLGLPVTASLDGLASQIFDAPSDSLPAAVSLDNLEHLYLRVPRGTDLIERLLTLMSETEPRIFWIGGITASSWQIISSSEPTAVSQVDVFDLPSLTAEAIRAAIQLRHRRSGLAIHYEEPATGRHLLRRRLRRMHDAEGYHTLLEDDYFGRLHKASGGHLALALYQWLNSADFASGDGVLMHQPERPDFSILDALDHTQNFTLKAFLEHRSLTLDEHDRIFRLPRHESYQIFESLRNRHLLEPVASGPSATGERSEIEEELRYRLRPLLTGVVISHLRARHIVY